jgi:hypothetical protein
MIKAFKSENIPAYFTVIVVFVVIATLIAGGTYFAVQAGASVGFTLVLTAFVGVMAGMIIMFGASLLNLRKLRPGFERLARGDVDPEIPPVWCPVLTSATEAAKELAKSLNSKDISGNNYHNAAAAAQASKAPIEASRE